MLESLSKLSEHDLNQMALALRAGRLGPPYAPIALARYCTPAVAAELSEEMREAGLECAAPAVMAVMLELVARERTRHSNLLDSVELVTTGPEAPGVTTRDTAIVVRELFLMAQRSVLVAGYAVYKGRTVFKALAERMEQVPELQVRMYLDVHRHRTDTSASSELVRRFAHDFKTNDWPGSRLPEVYYDPRSLEMDPQRRASLHAKCVVIDQAIAFVSSANFTEAAHVRNVEVGLLIKSCGLAARVADHFETLKRVRAFVRVDF